MHSIYFVAESGLEGAVRAILAALANFRPDGWSRPQAFVDEAKSFALVAAVKNGHLPVVNTLLAADAYPNYRLCGDAETPLNIAAMGGHLDILRVLIARGADIHTIDDEGGLTPLHRGASSDQAGAVDLLIEAGSEQASTKTHLFRGQRDIARAKLCLPCCSTERTSKRKTVAEERHCTWPARGSRGI